MKFCKFCGSDISQTGVCNCAESQNTMMQTTSSYSSEFEEFSGGSSAKLGKNKQLLILVGAVIIVAVILFSSMGSLFSSYKTPIKDFLNGIEKAKVSTMAKAFPKEIAKEMKDTADDEDLELIVSMLELAYGKNVKISFKVDDKEKLDKDDLKEMEKEYKKEYDKKINISTGYEVDLEVTFKGKKEKETENMSLVVVKISGQGWKLFGDGDMSSFF